MRLAILNLVQTPYREPLYNALSRTEGLTLRVFYMQSKDSVRGWSRLPCSYDAVLLPCLTPEPLYPLPLIGAVNPGLLPHLRRFQPDCLVVHGYSYWSQMQAMRWAIREGVPYLLWGDSNTHKLARAGPWSAVKERMLGYFCRHAAGALTIGRLNEQFWAHHGLEPRRHFRSPLAVDNDYFGAQAEIYRQQKAAHRQMLGLPAGRLLLYAGRFAPAKNLPALLLALEAYRRDGRAPLSLALVGDGPDRARIERLIRRHKLNGVFLFGFQKHSDLPCFYGISDALVLPSTDEPWGLVVNEAMAARLPVLLSRKTGCLPDLLEEGVNGWSFDETDVASVVGCLQRFSRSSEEGLRQMGRRSGERIAAWSQSQALAGIYRALETVTPSFRLTARSPAAVS